MKILEKYGKDIDMRLLNRNLENIREMQIDRKNTALKNLNEINPNKDYHCPICCSDDNKRYVDIYGYVYLECQKCKSIFLANLPDAEKLYQGNNDVTVEHYIDEEIFNKRKNIISKPKLDFVFECLNQYGSQIEIQTW